jgi:hypothetical protein
VGFLRPEQKFGSYPELVDAILRDVKYGDEALTPEACVQSSEEALYACKLACKLQYHKMFTSPIHVLREDRTFTFVDNETPCGEIAWGNV